LNISLNTVQENVKFSPLKYFKKRLFYVVLELVRIFPFFFIFRYLKKHEGYNSTAKQNDIALLYLTTDVTLNSFIQTACLPPYSSVYYPGLNMDVFAVGWGLLASTDSTTPNILYNVKLKTHTQSQCPYSIFNNFGMICAGKYNYLIFIFIHLLK
jgi:hypothetical protein